ncbi:MAG: sulfite exporter TauE/SafE family protein [Bryobacteraceae bacterium]
MDAVSLSTSFLLGVVSSLHCSQMCGPIVLAYSMADRTANRGARLSHIAYNGGRLITYSFLGAIAGLAGGRLIELGSLVGVERAASVFSGLSLVVAGLLLVGQLSSSVSARLIQIGGSMPQSFSRIAGRLLNSGGAAGKFALGLTLGFLPCGLVYAALLKSIDAGSIAGGAASMLAFGLGTAGALLSIGYFSTSITSRLGRHSHILAAASVLFLGAVLLWRGLSSPLLQMGHHHGHLL